MVVAGFKRKIFYLSGFDPRGARFYQELHAQQAALYAERTGRAVTVSDRARAGRQNSRWTITDASSDAATELTFLGWDDIIRAHWVKNPLSLIWRSLKATIAFTRQMDWSHGRHFPKGSLFAFYYPAVSAILLPILFTALLWLLFGTLLDWPRSLLASVAAGAAIALYVLRRIQGLWLLRFIIFNDRLASDARDPAIERRLDEMADTIAQSFDEPWDEVLLITHSNGSILTIPIMARLLARRDGTMPPHFALMTLGSCIPLVGCRRDATHFRAELEKVAGGDFLWLDLGSPTDGACIPLVNPFAPCQTTPRPRLHQLSPRWFRYCDPASYAARRRNKYEVHFDYLRTFKRLSPLDWIAVTSHARPLPAAIEAFQAENAE